MSEHWKKSYNPDHLPGFIETLIIFCILLVIGHTIVEDIAIIYHWDHKWMFYLTIAAVTFDCIFTAEFISRSIISFKHGHLKRYLLQERGWIDLLTSFPLLMLVSGPTLFVYLTHGESDSALLDFLIILKTAKAIRVTRVLRLIRIVKIFGKIQNTESKMTNRHVATISTIAVVSLISVLTICQFIPFLHFGDHGTYKTRRLAELSAIHASASSIPGELERTQLIKKMIQASGDEDIARIQSGSGLVIYESSPEVRSDLKFTLYPGDLVVPGTDWKARISYHTADAEHAKLNILVLFFIISIILCFMFIYTRTFAQQIADPIYVMDKGLRDWHYNLEVKVLPGREEEEISKLAKVFNTRWLPLKSQINSYRASKGEGEKSVLSIDSLL